MNLSPESIAPETESSASYEPPVVRLLGNVHDLLAMAKCNHCDGMDASMGEPDGSDHEDCPH